MPSSSEIAFEPSGGGVGAFVRNIDLSENPSGNVAGALRAALGEYGVLFFRDQRLSPEQHLSFARSMGPINVNRFFKPVDGHPEIAEVRKEPDQRANIGGGWHTDHSYDTEPAMGSVLLARETPPQGGDTAFANMYAAFDSLSEGLKQTLLGLRAVHSSRHVFGANSARRTGKDIGERVGNEDLATQDAVHPAVIRHPISGRHALYVNPGFTLHFEGWSVEESAPLLNYLYQHAARPEHTYRFQWENDSIAFWDNRATWHYAVNDYHGARRLMHRITIDGGPLS
ncbi:TauD/TfdA dioxygenase family protein [Minwuia sp.]|uniref:TauD/TfdA dioxygenase family protein n=1 Tax=Minwuia sp. TaxID=2493630 RepID=UPI003A922244